MYLDNLKDEAAERLSHIQSLVLGSLHDEDYTAGLWMYANEAPGVGAFRDCYDGGTVYWQSRSNAEQSTVVSICDSVSCYMYEHTSCNHTHDCCGCTFLTGINVAEMHTRSDEKTYVIVERWGRNV